MGDMIVDDMVEKAHPDDADNFYLSATEGDRKLSIANAKKAMKLAADIPYAFIYKTNNTPEPTTLTVNTPAKATITTTRDTNNTSSHWAMPSNNRITYTGASHKASISFFLTGVSGTGGGIFAHRIYKNGSAINSVVYSGKYHNTAAFSSNYQLSMRTDVADGDYFEIWYEQTTVFSAAGFSTATAVLQAEFEGWL